MAGSPAELGNPQTFEKERSMYNPGFILTLSDPHMGVVDLHVPSGWMGRHQVVLEKQILSQ